MKKIQPILTCGVSLVLVLGLASCSKPEPEKVLEPEGATAVPVEAASLELTSLDQKLSYSIGQNIGHEVDQDPNFEVDLNALIAGLSDSVEGRDPQLSEAEMRSAFSEIRNRVLLQAEEAGLRIAAEAEAFLAQNASRAGVVVTDSGLQYEVLVEGTGPKPAATNMVKVHYHGTLIDGTVFDSSVQRGEPIEFAVTGVIQGWVEALQLMPVGSKWKLFIPSELGYGAQGSGLIPPNSALIFEVELLEFR